MAVSMEWREHRDKKNLVRCKWRWGVALTTQTHLEPRLKRVEPNFYFHPRPSWPVLGRPLPLPFTAIPLLPLFAFEVWTLTPLLSRCFWRHWEVTSNPVSRMSTLGTGSKMNVVCTRQMIVQYVQDRWLYSVYKTDDCTVCTRQMIVQCVQDIWL
jgi:hypothetical protein